ncbi:MAG TPA: amino acid ABC transporter permease [Candidatus Limnocylindria bacterium]|nr:amino acid ABC transporter permease [Candidatus Limnocylindria bacterium]
MPTTFFGWIGFLLDKYSGLFLTGAANTLLIALVGTAAGFAIGLLVAIVRTITLRRGAGWQKRAALGAAKGVLAAYIEIFRGTPMIVQAMVVYYGASQYLGLNIPAMGAAFLVVSVNTGAYMAEIVRGGILSIDKGQTEAATAVGMTHWQMMTVVILPQAIRNILPSVANEFVVNIKDSSVLNVISVTEVFFQSKSAAGTYYRYFEVFFITAVIYFILTFTFTRLLRLLEKKMSGSGSYTVYGSQTDYQAEIEVGRKQ